MRVKATGTGFGLTEGKIYEVIKEYDTVYELQCDTGRFCRPKEFFEPVENNTAKEDRCSVKMYTVYVIDTKDWKLNLKDMEFFLKEKDALDAFNKKKDQYLEDKENWRHDWTCDYGDIKSPDKNVIFYRKETPSRRTGGYAIYLHIDTIKVQS